MRAADAAPPGARRALFALVDLAPTKELRSTVASLGPWATEPVCAKIQLSHVTNKLRIGACPYRLRRRIRPMASSRSRRPRVKCKRPCRSAMSASNASAKNLRYGASRQSSDCFRSIYYVHFSESPQPAYSPKSSSSSSSSTWDG